MKRHDPDMCANQLHDITLPGALNGAGFCLLCQRASQARHAAGESEPYGQDVCRRGHPYDENNTYINPASGKRTCRRCQRISNARSRLRKAMKNALR